MQRQPLKLILLHELVAHLMRAVDSQLTHCGYHDVVCLLGCQPVSYIRCICRHVQMQTTAMWIYMATFGPGIGLSAFFARFLIDTTRLNDAVDGGAFERTAIFLSKFLSLIFILFYFF